jgi:hypothetical protein
VGDGVGSWVPQARAERKELYMRGSSKQWAAVTAAMYVAGLLSALPLSGAVWVTNWIAFNDHRPGTGTGPNTTGYDMRVGPGGPLKDDLTGRTVAATLEVTATGAPDDFGTMSYPNAGSPAYNLFNGKVDLGNQGSGIGCRASSGTGVTLTFRNLNPAARYLFRGTSVRGGNYANRWTVCTLDGAAAFTDAHVDGSPNTNIITKATFPDATLAPNQVAYNSGENRVGSLVGWDAIDPGPDGTFSISSFQYTGPAPFGNPLSEGPYGYGLCGFMLIELVQPTPPQIVRQPPAQTTVEQGRPFSLSVEASGAPLSFQWYKAGEGAIPGATAPTYSVAAAALGDSGTYYVIVSNLLGWVKSIDAVVTVYPDTNAPAVVRAFSYPTFDLLTMAAQQNRVIVEFSEPMDPVTVSETIAYQIVDEFGAPLDVYFELILTNNNTTVILTTAPMIEDTLYTLTVDPGVLDAFNNPMGPNNTVQFRSWVSSPANGLLFEAFDAPGANVIATLTNSPTYPDNPFVRSNIYAFDSRAAFQDDSHEQYGSRTRGVFIPPYTGNWRFYVRADDPAQVFINPNGLDPAGKVLILNETGCCGDWNKYESPAIPLQAGQAYYIEALHKEGTGGDYVKVAARFQGTGLPTLGVPDASLDTNALHGAAIAWPWAPKDLGGPISIVGPADVAVAENQIATFTVSATNPAGLPMLYQWRRDGQDIPGATGPSYSFRPTLADNGAKFSVQVAKLGSVAVSAEATLTVTNDVTPPTVVAVHGSYMLNRVIVSFSELVDPQTAQDAVNYEFTAGFNLVGLPVLDATGTNVILTLDTPLVPGESYEINVSGVLDLAGNPMDQVTLTFPAFVLSRGFAMEQLYFNIGGTTIPDLVNNPKYPDSPDQVNYKTTLEGPIDTYDNYGTRLTGWLVPPFDGEYVFYFCSDDQGQFSLSPDENPANLVVIAREPGWSAARTWTGPGGSGDRGDPPANISTQMLAAAHFYAFEALGKEGGGGDNTGVAWKVPGGNVPIIGSPGIPGAFLYALADPQGASVTITQQPASVVAVYRGAGMPQTILLEDFNASPGGFTVQNYGSPVGPWSWNASSGSWTNVGDDPCACGGPYASGLRSPPITLAANGGVVLSFRHRYSFEGFRPGDPTPWDGGQVRLSVNGGPFATVPAANFSANGYVGPIAGSISSLLTSTPGWRNEAFIGESDGYSTGNFITSQVALGYFNAGDTLVIEFVTSWDDCCDGEAPNWEIDSVQVETGAAVPVTVSFTVGARSTYLWRPNTALTYVWQRNTGAGWEEIFGAYDRTYSVNVSLEDSGTQFRCVVYGPGASATSDVATLTVTLPVAITRQGDNVRISWPLNNAGFVLEQSPTLPGTTWTVVAPASYQTDATSVYVVLPVGSGNAFFRLKRP